MQELIEEVKQSVEQKSKKDRVAGGRGMRAGDRRSMWHVDRNRGRHQLLAEQ